MTRGSLYEFSVSAIHGYAGDLLFHTEVFISLATEFTFPARPVHPGNANSLSQFQLIDGCSFFHNAAGNLLPEAQRLFGDWNDLQPLAIGHVPIRMADAARPALAPHLLRSASTPTA